MIAPSPTLEWDIHGSAVRVFGQRVVVRLYVAGFPHGTGRDTEAFDWHGAFTFSGNLDQKARDLEAAMVKGIEGAHPVFVTSAVKHRMRLALGEALHEAARLARV